tara:strand:- start:2 stop:196 length:195 start_codon:yes stop_codon:yes gene_type:complete
MSFQVKLNESELNIIYSALHYLTRGQEKVLNAQYGNVPALHDKIAELLMTPNETTRHGGDMDEL